MLTGFENAGRANRAIFTYSNTGSPTHDLIHHISGRLLSDKPKDRDGGLGLNRLDFEFFSVIGKVLYKIDGDSTPVSQQDEEARLGTLAYGIKRLSTIEDTVEFIVCLDTICGEDCDSFGRKMVASYWYREIARRGIREVLKEMALLSMQLASLNPVVEEMETEIEDHIMEVGLQSEDVEFATLSYARKRLGNDDDAIAFILCLETICGRDCSGRDIQRTAAFYYNEMEYRGEGVVLKEMMLLATRLTRLNSEVKVKAASEEMVDGDHADSRAVLISNHGPDPKMRRSLFDEELASVKRKLRGCRKVAGIASDASSATPITITAEFVESLNELKSNGATIKELCAAFNRFEAMAQYDESGPDITMSSYDRTVVCGSLDPEFAADDLPEEARHLAGYLRRAYAGGLDLDEMWEEINAELKIIFPVSVESSLPKDYFPSNRTTGRVDLGAIERRPRFTSQANIELQSLTRRILKAMLDDCYQDVHLMAMRHNRAYRRFYTAIRKAEDTKVVGGVMQAAYAAKESGELPLKYFTLLNTVSELKRGRLMNARLSPEAYRLMQQIRTASLRDLRSLSWAFYGDNEPGHQIHSLSTQEQSRLWDALKERKQFFAEKGVALVMTNRLITKSEALTNLLALFTLSALYHRASRLPRKFPSNPRYPK
jgi:hypothetical protein